MHIQLCHNFKNTFPELRKDNGSSLLTITIRWSCLIVEEVLKEDPLHNVHLGMGDKVRLGHGTLNVRQQLSKCRISGEFVANTGLQGNIRIRGESG